MCKKCGHIFKSEITRWILNPIFFIAVFLSAAFNMADAFSDNFAGDILRNGDGYQTNALYILIYTSGSGLLKYVGLCLCTILASGLFAEDYRDNAVYMRVQRMGKTKYAFACVARTFISSWLCGFLAEIVSMFILVVVFNTALFPDKTGSGIQSMLIADGKMLSFSFIMCSICGLRFAFYALSALAFSVFIPNKSAVTAVPLLLFYFYQYLIGRWEWFPYWLSPSLIFDKSDFISVLLNVNEWIGFLYVIVVTLVFALISYLLIRVTLGRNRTFGGKME